jgi:threonine dehydratase
MAARVAACDQIAGERGYARIPPFEDRRVIAGQGTIGLEIAEDFAAALDGVEGIPQATPERPVVAVLSGGNIAPDLLARVVAGENTSYTG